MFIISFPGNQFLIILDSKQNIVRKPTSNLRMRKSSIILIFFQTHMYMNLKTKAKKKHNWPSVPSNPFIMLMSIQIWGGNAPTKILKRSKPHIKIKYITIWNKIVILMPKMLVQENKSGGHFLFSYLERSFFGGRAVTFESRRWEAKTWM